MATRFLTYVRQLCYLLVAVCFAATPITTTAQSQANDYATIGLTFSVPDTWQHDGLQTTSKAAFIKQFGWVYDKPDKDAIWNAVGRFSSVQVDSARLPGADAYTMHNLTIFVNRANTLYKQWLCQRHRLNLFQTKPLVKEDARLVSQKKLGPADLPHGLARAHGQSYQYQSAQTQLTTLGHVFAFVHQARCFEIKIESTAAFVGAQTALHQHILNTFELQPF